MSIPAPATLAITMLIGWPLIQLISVLMVRPQRARLKILAAELLSDPQLSAAEREIVEIVVDEARRSTRVLLSPRLILAPIIVPFQIFAMSLEQLLHFDKSGEPREW